ncbi:helix-turn-helix domain-containing protein [Streptomyces sp. SID625]|nr:helix-turn-helix domain-containing protein [Streptomyces sp. SID625]
MSTEAFSLPSVTSGQAPARIVVGVYLRSLRKSQGMTLPGAARALAVTKSALSRWEHAQSPIDPRTLRLLLHLYGVAPQHIRYLLSQTPPQRHTRGKTAGIGEHDPFDQWPDAACLEAWARYVAVMHTAGEVLQYAPVRFPPGVRTEAYSRAVLDQVWSPQDEPGAQMPGWVHTVTKVATRRTVLVDEALLQRPIGGPEVAAAQLRHVLRLVRSPQADAPRILVLPVVRAYAFADLPDAAEVTVHGHRMVTGAGLTPFYGTGPAADVIATGLRDAAARACGQEESCARIERAADAMDRRTAS